MKLDLYPRHLDFIVYQYNQPLYLFRVGFFFSFSWGVCIGKHLVLLYSGITPGGSGGPYIVLGTEPRLALVGQAPPIVLFPCLSHILKILAAANIFTPIMTISITSLIDLS